MYAHKNNSKGFSLIELVVVLAVVAMGSVLLGALFKQLNVFSKSSKQIGTLLEIRTMANTLIKDPKTTQEWLDRMRSREAVYSGCIPPNASATTTFDCPAPDATLKADLGTVANGYHVISAPLYNEVGAKIAGKVGSVGSEVLMTSEGTPCSSPDSALCTLKATGYLLRTNSTTTGNPGSVKFVMKVEKRPAPEAVPMKPQFVTMNVGTDWNRTLGTCPPGSLKMGTQGNGTAHCVPIATNCPTGQITLGILPSGAPKCVTMPSCASGQLVNIGSDGDLECTSAETPCPRGSAHLGFYSGTQTPICSTSLAGCPSGQMQVGINTSGASVTPICRALPTCTANQQLSYNGTSFICVNEFVVAGSSCSVPGEVVVGINNNGGVVCGAVSSSSSSTGSTLNIPICDTGKFLTKNAQGNLVCKAPGEELLNCAAGKVMVSKGQGLGYECKTVKEILPSCTAGQTLVVNAAGDTYVCKDATFNDNIAGRDLIWEGALSAGNIITGDQTLINGKKFSDYNFIYMMGHNPNLTKEELKGAGMNLIPVSVFKAQSDRYFGYQAFSGDDTGYAFIKHKSDTAFTYKLYRGGVSLTKIYGVGKKN